MYHHIKEKKNQTYLPKYQTHLILLHYPQYVNFNFFIFYFSFIKESHWEEISKKIILTIPVAQNSWLLLRVPKFNFHGMSGSLYPTPVAKSEFFINMATRVIDLFF